MIIKIVYYHFFLHVGAEPFGVVGAEPLADVCFKKTAHATDT
jgi:hypothetical protein